MSFEDLEATIDKFVRMGLWPLPVEILHIVLIWKARLNT
jgi:hypothetical protein